MMSSLITPSAPFTDPIENELPETIVLVDHQVDRQRAGAIEKRCRGAEAGHPRQILFGGKGPQILALGLDQQRRGLPPGVAMMIGKSAPYWRVDTGGSEGRKEFFRIADPRKSEYPGSGERRDRLRIRPQGAAGAPAQSQLASCQRPRQSDCRRTAPECRYACPSAGGVSWR